MHIESFLDEKFIDFLPKFGQPPLIHVSPSPLPPLSLWLLQEFREQYHGYEAFLRFPRGMILLNLPLSFRQVETLQLEETTQSFFFRGRGETRREGVGWGLFPLSPRGLRNGNTFTRLSSCLSPLPYFFFFL